MGALLVLAAAALWSTGGVGVKVANAEPLVIAGLRSVFAFAFMSIVLLVTMRRRGDSARVVIDLLKRPLVWAAAASYALMVVMFCLSARRTTAANAIFIQYTAPVYVALLSTKLLGEKPSAGDYGAVFASLAGMALTFGGELETRGRMEGNLLAVLSSFGFAGLPLCLRIEEQRRAEPLAPLVAMTLGNVIAAVVALPSCIRHPPADQRTWVVLVALGTIQIGLPYVLYGMAVRRLRALESSLLAMIEPVLSPIWVLLATGEKPSVMAAFGGAVIVASVAANAIHRSLRQRPRPASS
jgi:drug/metabolite transporter, DME family